MSKLAEAASGGSASAFQSDIGIGYSGNSGHSGSAPELNTDKVPVGFDIAISSASNKSGGISGSGSSNLRNTDINMID